MRNAALQILVRCGAAPFQFLVLVVALAKLPRDLRTRQLHAQIESMGSVIVHVKMGIKLEGIGFTPQPFTIVDTYALLAKLDAETRIFDLSGNIGDFCGAVAKWSSVMQPEQAVTTFCQVVRPPRERGTR